jgi:hypothetical protein
MRNPPLYAMCHSGTTPMRSIVFCTRFTAAPRRRRRAANRYGMRSRVVADRGLRASFGQFFVKLHRGCSIAAPYCHSGDLKYPDTAVESGCNDIATFHITTRRRHPDAINPDMPCDNKGRRTSAGAYDARVPQPSINPLPIARCLALAARQLRPPQRRSLAAASSCALRAASLANGEFGSACFSRSRCAVKSRRSLLSPRALA